MLRVASVAPLLIAVAAISESICPSTQPDRDARARNRPDNSAIARNAQLATRNVGDFERLGLSLVNPWTD